MDKATKAWRDSAGRILCQEELCNQQCDSQCPVYLKVKGDEKILTKQYGRATFFYLQAVSIADDYTEAWEKLAACYEKIGKTTEAAFARNRTVGSPNDVYVQPDVKCVAVVKPAEEPKASEKCAVSDSSRRKHRGHNDLVNANMLLLSQDIESLYSGEKYSECINSCNRFDRMYGFIANSGMRARIDSIKKKCVDEVYASNEEERINKSRHRNMAIVAIITLLVIVSIIHFFQVYDPKKMVASGPASTLTPKPTVTATKPVATEVPQQSIWINGSKNKVQVGKTIKLEVSTAFPLRSSETVQWSSSDSAIARVYNTGMVQGIKPGTVTITAKLSDEIKATCQLAITPQAVKQENGFVIKPIGKSDAPVTIHAPEDGSCYVVFVPEIRKISDVWNGGKKFSLFINAGETTEVCVPVGKYEVSYATGEEWYGREYKFGDQTRYYKAEAEFEFYYKGDYVYGTVLTLYKVKDGNMETKEVDESEFPD